MIEYQDSKTNLYFVFDFEEKEYDCTTIWDTCEALLIFVSAINIRE